MNTDSFPKELLGQPLKDRLAYFQGFTIAHPLLISAYEDTLRTIYSAKRGSLILLYGPSGVGKTTLLEKLCKEITESSMAELENDTEKIPVIMLETASSDTGMFNWKDFFERFLIQLNDPFPDKKIAITELDEIYMENLKLLKKDNSSKARYRRAVENTLKHRRPIVVLLDEAQHFANVASGRKLLDQLNVIKSLANQTKTTFVLCGTYELLPFRNLNGQLSRRSIDIHFGRYKFENEEHQEMFINALWMFQQNLPLEITPKLIDEWEYFYERSIGCVGILKDWLALALEMALNKGDNTLKPAHWKKYELSVASSVRLTSETTEGERAVLETKSERLKLQKMLGFYSKVKESKEGSDSSTLKKASNLSAKKKTPIGIRNAMRDSIK